MKILEKNYTTKVLRPHVSVFKSNDMDLLILITSWGEGSSVNLINEEINKFLFAAQGDMEVTSPFEFNTSLSKKCNSLRMATLITNEMIYRTENKSDLKTVYEMVILYKDKNLLSWLQIGSPHVLLVKENIQPISSKCVGQTFAQNKNLVLPNQFFGAEPHCHFQVGSVSVDKSDKILLLNSELVAPGLWSTPVNSLNLEEVAKKQIQFRPEESFWSGIIECE